jgi:glutathione S-transferase
MQLYIGNKNYSSWSLRPWMLMRHLELEFEEHVIPLDTPQFRERIRNISPTGRVPVLLHAGLRIWDSLAICEYACEVAGAGWPADADARAVARAAACEMHSGFAALRSQWPMNARATGRRVPMSPALDTDLRRIGELWSELRLFHGEDGPWLCSEYSVADAMFAPVLLRLATYGGRELLPANARDYLDFALQDPILMEWRAAAAAEPWVLEASEVGAEGGRNA